MSDHEQQLALRRGKVLEALARAERRVFTRPAPKSAKAQVKFLLTRAKGSTQALAERLGVSRRTEERYRAGKLTTPQKRLQAAELQEAGATEEDLHPIVAEAITESYFTEWGTRAAGLRADFTHVSKIGFRF